MCRCFVRQISGLQAPFLVFTRPGSSLSSSNAPRTHQFWFRQRTSLALIPRRDDRRFPVGWLPLLMFRVMLYRLHVNSLLRERQVVALIDRFDVGRKGK